MNQNRPFYATNTNCYDESFRSSAPTTLNGESVILSQEQQRRVCDTLNTSIVGNPFGISGNQPMLWAQKQYFPGGVMFTFPSAQMGPQNITQGGPTQNSVPIQFSQFHQAPVAVNTFFPSSMEYQQAKGCGVFGYPQQPPTEPFQLKFHHNRGTSSSDLLGHISQVPPSQGLPDLSNIMGALEQKQACAKKCQLIKESLFPSPPIEFSSNARRLILSEIVPPPSGHVVDILEESGKDANKKTVSFSDPNDPATEEKSSQITSECICDAKKCQSRTKVDKKQKGDDNSDSTKDKRKKKKGKREKKKEKERSETASETNLSSDCEDHSGDPQKQKQKDRRWWGREKNLEDRSSETQSSDSEGEKSGPKRHKKKKNKKKQREPKTKNDLEVKLKDNESQTDTSNAPDSDSEPESCHC